MKKNIAKPNGVDEGNGLHVHKWNQGKKVSFEFLFSPLFFLQTRHIFISCYQYKKRI